MKELLIKKFRIASIVTFIAVLICAVIAGVALFTASPVAAATSENSDTEKIAESVEPRAAFITVAQPSVQGTYFYTGANQTVNLANFVSNKMERNGEVSATEPGTYHITISLYDSDKYTFDPTGATKVSSIELSWTIEKAKLSKPAISGSNKLVYNRNIQTISLNNYDENLMNISDSNSDNLPDNKGLTVGTYNLSISLKDTARYAWSDNTSTAVSLPWQIEKATLYISKLSWDYAGDNAFFYNNTTHKVEVTGFYDAGLTNLITVTYTTDGANIGNAKVNAGEYTAKATFDYDRDNYTTDIAEADFPACDWKINKAVYDMSHLEWVMNGLNEDGVFVYDRTPKSIDIVGLPIGVMLGAYSGTKSATDAGSYQFIVLPDEVLYDTKNYEKPVFPEDFLEPFDWQILKADYDMSGVHWDYTADTRYVYDSTEFSVKVIGTFPYEVSVKNYEGNKFITAGPHTATVTFNYDVNNYNDPAAKFPSCDWEIEKADIRNANVVITTPANEIIYKSMYPDSQKEWRPDFNVSFLDIDSTDYTVEFRNNINAGLATITLYAKAESINFTGTVRCQFEILKATFDVSRLKWAYSEAEDDLDYRHFVYDSDKTDPFVVEAHLDNIPKDITLNYSDNSELLAGEYHAKVTLSYNVNNYNVIGTAPECVWNIYPCELTKPVAKVGLFYDGTRQLGLDHFDSETMSGVNYFESNANTYNAVIDLIDTRNYCWADDHSTDSLTIVWTLERANLINPVLSKSSSEYSSKAFTFDITGYENTNISLPLNWKRENGTITVNAYASSGVYRIAITPDSNHKWTTVDGVSSETGTLYLPYYIYYNIGSGGDFNNMNLAMLMGKIMGRSSSVASYGELKNYIENHASRTGGEIDAVVSIDGELWQVVFADKSEDDDVTVTLWYLGTTLTSKWGGWTSADSTVNYPSNMYSSSYIRSFLVGSDYATNGSALASGASVQDAQWKSFMGSYGSFITTPSKFGYQANLQGYLNERYGGGDAYGDKPGYGAWSEDMLWLPGITETGYLGFSGGLWGLDNAGSFAGTYWLRSGVTGKANFAIYAGFNGMAEGGVDGTYAVRPAFHLNLRLAAENAGLIIETPTLSQTNASYSENDITFTISGKDNVTVTLPAVASGMPEWTILGDLVTIPGKTPVMEAGYNLTVLPNDGYCWSGDFGSEPRFITFMIEKATYAMDDIKWDYDDVRAPKYYKYNTEQKVLINEEDLPDGITVATYTDNAKIDAGEYVAKVTFNYDVNNYVQPVLPDLHWEIHKANADVLNLRWQDETEFVYDGRQHGVSIIGLPENSDVNIKEYTGTYFETNAGEYTANVVFDYSEKNYNTITLAPCKWYIRQAILPVPTVLDRLTYKGSLQSIVPQLENFDPATMNISGHEGTAVKEYTAVVSLKNTQNYRWEGEYTVEGDEIAPVSLTWYIDKATYDMSNAHWEYSGAIPYDGNEKTVYITGYPVNITPTYDGAKGTAVNKYTASIVNWVYDFNNYNEPVMPDLDGDGNPDNILEWEICKGRFDVSGIRWDYDSQHPPVYRNGLEHRVVITGFPNGLTPTYVYEKKNADGSFTITAPVNAGEYRATVSFIFAEGNYEAPDFTGTDFETSLIWNIAKADYDISKVHWNYGSAFDYDNVMKEVKLVGLPDGVSVVYSGNTATNAGEYTAVVTGFTCDDGNYNAPSPSSIPALTWKINKINYDMSRVAWNYNIEIHSGKFIFDGQNKSVRVVNLPSGIEVKEYSQADAIGAGNYTAKVVAFDYNETNYNAPEFDLTCEWIINKAVITSDMVEWNIGGGNSYSFDGLNHVPVASVEFNGTKYNLTVALTSGGNPVDEATNVGSYIATAVESPNFVIEGEATTRSLTVTKATITESNINWNFTDGEMFKTGVRPDKVSATIKIGDKEFAVNVNIKREDGSDVGNWTDGLYIATVTLVDGEANFVLSGAATRSFRLDSSLGNANGESGFMLNDTWKLMIFINAIAMFILTVVLITFVLIKRHSVNTVYNGIDDGDGGFYESDYEDEGAYGDSFKDDDYDDHSSDDDMND